MKGLPNLIRLHRWRLDEKRKNLADLERLAAQLRDRGLRLEDEMRHEQDAAAGSSEAGYAYGPYAKTVISRREAIAASLAEVRSKIAQAAEAVSEAFRELKRFEVAQERREQAAKDKTAKQERQMLDELGLQGHRSDGSS